MSYQDEDDVYHDGIHADTREAREEQNERAGIFYYDAPANPGGETMTENLPATVQETKALVPVSMLDVQSITAQVQLIQAVMAEVMHEGEHYGVIPGTDKPTLYKAGAEKLAMTFRMAHEYEYAVCLDGMPPAHREYRVTCRLVDITTGKFLGEGVGSCSTMEAKYRWRNVADYELTGQPIPKDSKERKAEYRKQGLGMKKINGAWEWVRYKDSARVENPDIADTYNTVLKMAAKRAAIAATLSATAASDIFTQDLEDTAEPTPVAAGDPWDTPNGQTQADVAAHYVEVVKDLASDMTVITGWWNAHKRDVDALPALDKERVLAALSERKRAANATPEEKQ